MAAKWLGMGFEMIGGNLVLLLQFFVGCCCCSFVLYLLQVARWGIVGFIDGVMFQVNK